MRLYDLVRKNLFEKSIPDHLSVVAQRLGLSAVSILLMLILSLVGGTLLIGFLVQHHEEVNAFDRFGYNLVANGFHHPLLDALVAPFNFNFLPAFSFLPGGWAVIPSYLHFFWIGLLLYLFFFKRESFPWAIITIVLGSLFTVALYEIASTLVFRERPFLVLPNTVDEYARSVWASWTSFPSGHSRDTALYATIVAAYVPRLRWAMLFFTLFIAWSRVYLGAHYPTDVIVGVIVGYGAAHVAISSTKKLQVAVQARQSMKQQHKLPTNPETADLKKV